MGLLGVNKEDSSYKDEQGISGTQERVPAVPTVSAAFGYCTQLDLGSFRVIQSSSRT